MISEITRRINQDTGVSIQRIEATIRLIQEGATIPFIARYRKEATGNLDDARLRRIAERYLAYGQLVQKRTEIVSSVRAQGKLTPRLRERIEACETENELEDLYLAYRPKRQSKAGVARRSGLEPLADYIHQQSGPAPVADVAARFVDAETHVDNVEQAVEGALRIIAERIAEDAGYRKWLRDLMVRTGTVRSKAVKGKEGQKTKYSTYYDFVEPVARIPSHRMLAIRRGTREKVLAYSIEIDAARARAELKSRARIDAGLPSAALVERAADDSFDRLLEPVIQNEVRNMLRERAEEEAIRVIEDNLTALLLAPPAGPIPVLGIDPNPKGASRLAVLGHDGRLVEHHTLRLREKTPEAGPSEPATDSRSEKDAAAAASPDGDQPAPPDGDQSTPTAGDQSASPDGDQSASLAGDQSASLARDQSASPDGDQSASPDGDQSASLARDQSASLARDQSASLAGDQSASPDGDQSASPDGDRSTPPDRDATPNGKPVGEPGIAGKAPAASEGKPAAAGSEVSAETPADGATGSDEAAARPQADPERFLVDLVNRTRIRGIVIGHGAGSREIENFVRSVTRQPGMDVFVLVATEGGASAYASSFAAREEFPQLDTATRRAVSVARRLQDPLTELVKIDPRQIGVGQYPHDVDQEKLAFHLDGVVGSAVNRVGVDVNTASPDLLRHVAGFSPELARNVVDRRSANGSFSTLEDVRAIDGVDERVFSQAAGFLRVRDGAEPMDGTFIHPESYALVRRMAETVGVSATQLLGNAEKIRAIRFEAFEQETGHHTLADLRNELSRPGRDPRKKFAVPRFRDDVREISDLEDGMELEGIITNVTNFGAFVDVGVRQDGLVHISELSHRYVSDARQAARMGDVVKVKVIGVDAALKRISLSVKAAIAAPKPRPKPRKRPADGRGPSKPRRPVSKEAAASTRRKPRRDGREAAAAPARPLSMEEKIRLLQEKFKGPDA